MTIEVRRVYDVPDTRSRGEMKAARVVELYVDGQGPLFIEVPHDELTNQAVRERIEQEAALVRAILTGG